MKKLVVYYSYEGSTKLISETIAKAVIADLLEIKPEKEMTSKGFMKFVWGGSQVMMGKKPPLKPLARDPSEYDMIFIGTPVWNFSLTPPIKTFVEDHLPEGKKVAFFCSFDGNSGKTFERLEKACRGSEVLGTQEFLSTQKNNSDAILRQAVDWARSIFPRKQDGILL
ncbi:MAG: flavodoxin family protein [Thermoplasmatota archaeon]